jgi:hypothetical protein
MQESEGSLCGLGKKGKALQIYSYVLETELAVGRKNHKGAVIILHKYCHDCCQHVNRLQLLLTHTYGLY